MKKPIIWLVGIAAILVLGAVGYKYSARGDAAATSTAAANKKGVEGSTPKLSTIEFSTSDLLTLGAGDISRSIPITGSLKPINQALLKAKIAGELQAFTVREGMAVTSGQLIAKIESTELQSKTSEREAQLRGANLQIEQAKRNLDSNKALLEKNFISQNAFDLTRSNYDVAVANRDAIAQQLVQSRKLLADTRIVSPINGVISERFVQPGEKLGVDARIVSIVDLSRMEIEAPIPASDIAAVAIGQTISLEVEGVAGEQLGKVSRIAPSTQAGTRSVLVYVSLDNKNPQIRAGMFAQGGLNIEKRSNVVTVPLAALRETAGRTFVYIIKDGKLAEREIKLGLRNDRASASNGSSGVVEVTQGLKAGEEIVAINLGPLAVDSQVVKKGTR
jgi:membrane fusion protein, multidrug efflux system